MTKQLSSPPIMFRPFDLKEGETANGDRAKANGQPVIVCLRALVGRKHGEQPAAQGPINRGLPAPCGLAHLFASPVQPKIDHLVGRGRKNILAESTNGTDHSGQQKQSFHTTKIRNPR